MKTMAHVCTICGHIHDEETEGKWETLSEDFCCPMCNADLDLYELTEIEN
jgi:hypothetical protein